MTRKDDFNISRTVEHSIIVDMDHVKVDFHKQCVKLFRSCLPKEAFKNWRPEKYYFEEVFEPQYHGVINEIVCSKNFFFTMEPMAGAIEAVKEMEKEKLNITICTTPHPNSEFCINEKIDWVKKYLGASYAKKMVFTYDKTIITGDVLIDDKPSITGYNQNPTWTHVLFTAGHNEEIETEHRLCKWEDWRSIIYPILEQKT